jgi:four helix bundle protein
MEERTPERDSGEKMAERFLAFAVGTINLVGRLSHSTVGQHVGHQLLRCGTSPGANYEETRGAESRADFVHKMGVVLKELKESRYWLRGIAQANLVPRPVVTPLLTEVEELCAITARSILTAKSPCRTSGHHD